MQLAYFIDAEIYQLSRRKGTCLLTSSVLAAQKAISEQQMLIRSQHAHI